MFTNNPRKLISITTQFLHASISENLIDQFQSFLPSTYVLYHQFVNYQECLSFVEDFLPLIIENIYEMFSIDSTWIKPLVARLQNIRYLMEGYRRPIELFKRPHLNHWRQQYLRMPKLKKWLCTDLTKTLQKRTNEENRYTLVLAHMSHSFNLFSIIPNDVIRHLCKFVG